MAQGAFVGRTADNLTWREQRELAGKWVAVELYSPETLPFRTFQAVEDSASECRRALRQRGLDPARFEYFPLRARL